MKIKEVATKEIHWLLPWNPGPQANDRLRQKLGNSLCSYFARINVGKDSYVWNIDINGKWRPLTKDETAEEALARQRWDEVKQEVRAHLNSEIELVEKILTIPNDEYIYYQIDATGQVKVLVTGWGFTNFKGVVIGNGSGEIDKPTTHPVSVAFTIDGQKVPNRDFFIVAPQKNVPHTTDAEGNYALGNLSENTTFEVIDGPTGRKFSIQTDRTTTEYTFDVTEFVNVSVEAVHDKQPISGETATLNYHGRTYELTLSNGSATISLPLYGGDACIARFREAMQQQELNLSGHTFRFESTTPIMPPPPPGGGETGDGDGEGEGDTGGEGEGEGEVVTPEPEPRDISVQVVDRNMKPFARGSITFKQGEKTLEKKLDERGITYLAKDDFATGQPLSAQVSTPGRTIPPIPFTLDEGETQYVLQEVKPKGLGDYLGEILAALGAAIGLVGAFFIGGGIIDFVSKLILELI